VVSASLNAASYNRRGAATYASRVDRYTARRLSIPVDVVNLQEVGNGLPRWGRPNCFMRSRLDVLWGDTYRRHIGSDGRYCYSHRLRVKPIKSGVITAARSTWYRGDDKQAAYLVFRKADVLGMDVSFHLESALGSAAEAKRVAQMGSIAAGAVAIADEYGVDLRNILFVGDANSEQLVAAQMAAEGWRNVASDSAFFAEPTFADWDGRACKRYDYGFVHVTAAPASLSDVLHDPEVSDHAELVIERTLVV
jgi:endonuclease/exonuclease/phosphatase family metal-dependent hydrolase